MIDNLSTGVDSVSPGLVLLALSQVKTYKAVEEVNGSVNGASKDGLRRGSSANRGIEGAKAAKVHIKEEYCLISIMFLNLPTVLLNLTCSSCSPTTPHALPLPRDGPRRTRGPPLTPCRTGPSRERPLRSRSPGRGRSPQSQRKTRESPVPQLFHQQQSQVRKSNKLLQHHIIIVWLCRNHTVQ